MPDANNFLNFLVFVIYIFFSSFVVGLDIFPFHPNVVFAILRSTCLLGH